MLIPLAIAQIKSQQSHDIPQYQINNISPFIEALIDMLVHRAVCSIIQTPKVRKKQLYNLLMSKLFAHKK